MDIQANPTYARKPLRLDEFDYAQDGAYFVTVCTDRRVCLFGDVADGEMRLNVFGNVADACWRGIPEHSTHATLDAYVVMPNHIHGIVIINHEYLPASVGARHAVPLQTAAEFGKPVPGSLATVVRSYKSAVTREINLLRGTHGQQVWQRNYYDHIIRNTNDADRIRVYIDNNPACWADDENHPSHIS